MTATQDTVVVTREHEHGADESLLTRMIKEAWREISWIDRISLVLFTFPPLIFLGLGLALSNLAHRKKPISTDGPTRIQNDVYQLYYREPNEGCNSTTLRDSVTGSLLIHSAPPCTDENIVHIEALGKIEVLLVPSTAHDSHADAWSKRYPAAKVLAHPLAAPELSCRVDETYDTQMGKELMKKYGIVDWVDLSPHQRFPDAHLLISKPDNVGQERCLVLAACGFLGARNTRLSILLYPLGYLAGLGAGRVTRHACLLFIKDCDRVKQDWTELVSRPSVELVLFQHGEPLPATRAKDWLVTRNPFKI